MPRTIEEYKQLRSLYTPKIINYIFLLESPPVSGAYFYDKNCITREHLFRAMMNLIGYSFQNPLTVNIKEKGLRRFQECGCIIIDSIYTPVDNLNDNIADNLILLNYPNLKTDLEYHCSKNTKIIIVKTTLFHIVNTRLIAGNFNVINGGIPVPFPANGQQTRFYNAIELIKQQNNIVVFC